MKLGVLFSGGKDSTLALHYAKEAVVLISILSESPDSYMFHTPNMNFVEEQAEAIGLPIILQRTKGEKEKELEDLRKAILRAKQEFGVEGIVTGAIESVYQASRIQRICNELSLECFNPLWQKDQFEILHELMEEKFEVMIIGVFGEGMESFLGRTIDAQFVEDMKSAFEKYRINPAGEGGEFESFVLNGPVFKRGLKITKSHKVGGGYSQKIVIEGLG